MTTALHKEILGLLKAHPRGLSTSQLCEHLKRPAVSTISNIVSKLGCYGAIDKVRDPAVSTKTVWRAKADA